MTRIGINPARGKISDYIPARVTVTVLTYIPSLDGYFTNRMDVLKLAFSSLGANTTFPHDVMVFDNGSCQAVVDYLLDLKAAGQVDYLILSKQNIGKIGALKILFHAAPGEVIAYNDDDIFFYPGWLEAQLDILERFPKAGAISGLPVRNAGGYARKSIDQTASHPPPGITVAFERRIPDEWEMDWAFSTGRDPSQHLQAQIDWIDTIFSLQSLDRPPLDVIGGANHFQFITRKEIACKVLPSTWSGKLMGAMVEMDNAFDQLGLLRLSTVKRYTRHLGNTLSQDVLDEIGVAENQPGNTPQKKTIHRKNPILLRIPGSHRFFTALYRKLFDILYR